MFWIFLHALHVFAVIYFTFFLFLLTTRSYYKSLLLHFAFIGFYIHQYYRLHIELKKLDIDATKKFMHEEWTFFICSNLFMFFYRNTVKIVSPARIMFLLERKSKLQENIIYYYLLGFSESDVKKFQQYRMKKSLDQKVTFQVVCLL